MRLRLSIQVAPLPPQGPANSLFPGLTSYRRPQQSPQKFVHLAGPEITIGELWRQIEQAYTVKYLTQSDYGQFQIKKLQDEDDSDLDNDYTIGELFEGQTGSKIIKVVQCHPDRESSIPVTSTLRPLGQGPSPYKRPLPPVPAWESNKKPRTEQAHEHNEYLDVHPDRPVRSKERDLGSQELDGDDAEIPSARKNSHTRQVSRRVLHEQPQIEDSEDERERERQERHRGVRTPGQGRSLRDNDYAYSENAALTHEEIDEARENELNEPDEFAPADNRELNDERENDDDDEDDRHWNLFSKPAYPASKSRQHFSSSPEQRQRDFLVSPELPHNSNTTDSNSQRSHSRPANTVNESVALNHRRASREMSHRSSEWDSTQAAARHRTSRSARMSSPTPSIQITGENIVKHSPPVMAANKYERVKSSPPVTAAKNYERIQARRIVRGENPDLDRSPAPRMRQSSSSLADTSNIPRSGRSVAREISTSQPPPDSSPKETLIQTKHNSRGEDQAISVSPKVREQLQDPRRAKSNEVYTTPTPPDPRRRTSRKMSVGTSPELDLSDPPRLSARPSTSAEDRPSTNQPLQVSETISSADKTGLGRTRTSSPDDALHPPMIFQDQHGVDHSSPMRHVKDLSQLALRSNEGELSLTRFQQGPEEQQVHQGVLPTHDELTLQYFRSERAKQALPNVTKSAAEVNTLPTEADGILDDEVADVQIAVSSKPKVKTVDSLGKSQVRIKNDQSMQLEERRRIMREKEERQRQLPPTEFWSFSQIDEAIPEPQEASFRLSPEGSQTMPHQHSSNIDQKILARIPASPLGEPASRYTQSSHAFTNSQSVAVVISSSKEENAERVTVSKGETASIPAPAHDNARSEAIVDDYQAEAGPSISQDPFEVPDDVSESQKKRKTPLEGFSTRNNRPAKKTKQSLLIPRNEVDTSKGKNKAMAKMTDSDHQLKMQALTAATSDRVEDNAGAGTAPEKQSASARHSFTAANHTSPFTSSVQTNLPAYRPSESSKSKSPEKTSINHNLMRMSASKSPAEMTKHTTKKSPSFALESPPAIEMPASVSEQKSASKSPTDVRKATITRDTTHDSQETQDIADAAEVVEIVPNDLQPGDGSAVSDQQPARYLPSSSDDDGEPSTDDQESGTDVSDDSSIGNRSASNNKAMSLDKGMNARSSPHLLGEQKAATDASPESTLSQSQSVNTPLHSPIQKLAEGSTQSPDRHDDQRLEDITTFGSSKAIPLIQETTPDSATSKHLQPRKDSITHNASRVTVKPTVSIRKGSSSDGTASSSTPGSLKRPTQPILKMAGRQRTAKQMTKKIAAKDNIAQDNGREEDDDRGTESISDSQIDPKPVVPSKATKTAKNTPTKVNVSANSSSSDSSEGDDDEEVETIVKTQNTRQPLKRLNPTSKATKPASKRSVSKANDRSSDEDDDSETDSIRDSQIDQQPAKVAASAVPKTTPARAAPALSKSSDTKPKSANNALKPGPKFLEPKTPAKATPTAKAVPQSRPASAVSGMKSKTVATGTSTVHKSPPPGTVSTPTSYQKPSLASTATATKPANRSTPASKPTPQAKPAIPTPRTATSSTTKPTSAAKTTFQTTTKTPLSRRRDDHYLSSNSLSSTSSESETGDSDDDSSDENQPETLADEAAREAAAQQAAARAAASGRAEATKGEQKRWDRLWKFSRRFDKDPKAAQRRLASGTGFEGFKGGRSGFEELRRRFG